MAESTISPNTTAQDTLNVLNYQAAQIAAGLNINKQISGQINSLNMNIGKVNAGINRMDANLVQINNYQKAMNMNIGKVAAAVDRLGVTFKDALSDSKKGQLNSSTMTTKMNILASKQDETNRILGDILRSFGGNSRYEAVENKLESKDTNSLLTNMSASLTSIDETLKRIEKGAGLNGGGPAPAGNNNGGGGFGIPSWLRYLIGPGLVAGGSAALYNNTDMNSGARTGGYLASAGGGALTGYQIGRMFGPTGAVIGAGLGSIGGVVSGSYFDTARNQMYGRSMGLTYSPQERSQRQSEFLKQVAGTKFTYDSNGYYIDGYKVDKSSFDAAIKQIRDAGGTPDVKSIFSAGQNGPSFDRYGRTGPNTTMMDMAVAADVMNRNAGRGLPLASTGGPSFERYGRGAGLSSPQIISPMSATTSSYGGSYNGTIPLYATDASRAVSSDTIPLYSTSAGTGSAFNTRDVLEQQQAQIEQKSKEMTTGDMLYQAKDVLYKATNIKFEASNIQFLGGAMGAAGSAMGGGQVGSSNGYGPYSNGGGAGNTFNGGGDISSGNYSGDTGGGGTQRQLSDAQKTALQALEKTGSYTVREGETNPLAGISSDVMGKSNIKVKSGPHGDYYTYERPTGDQTTTTSGSTFKDTDFVTDTIKDKAAVSRVQVQDQIMKEAKAQGIDIPPEVAKIMAASIAGQAYQESTYNPKAKHDKKNGVYTGAGMYGHGGPRMTAALNWIKENKLDPNSMEAWNRFFAHEIMTATNETDPQLVTLRKKLMSGEMSLEEATQAVLELGERPRADQKAPGSESARRRQEGAAMAMGEPKRISGGGSASLTDTVQSNMPIVERKGGTGGNFATPEGMNILPSMTTGEVRGQVGDRRNAYRGRKAGTHQGIDVYSPEGTPIYSPFDGQLTGASRSQGAAGKKSIIRGTLPNGQMVEIRSYHLQDWAEGFGPKDVAKNGNIAIKKGDVIGYVGKTGAGGGDLNGPAHHHLETYFIDENGKAVRVNPNKVFGYGNNSRGLDIESGQFYENGKLVSVAEPEVTPETSADGTRNLSKTSAVADTESLTKDQLPQFFGGKKSSGGPNVYESNKIPRSGEFSDSSVGFSTTSATEAYYAKQLYELKKAGKISEAQYRKGIDYIKNSRDNIHPNLSASSLPEDLPISDLYTKSPPKKTVSRSIGEKNVDKPITDRVPENMYFETPMPSKTKQFYDRVPQSENYDPVPQSRKKEYYDRVPQSKPEPATAEALPAATGEESIIQNPVIPIPKLRPQKKGYTMITPDMPDSANFGNTLADQYKIPRRSVEAVDDFAVPGSNLNYEDSYSIVNRNGRQAERVDQLYQAERSSTTRSIQDKKRADERMDQSIRNREAPEPKHPKSTRRELDSVLVRHADWYKNFSALA